MIYHAKITYRDGGGTLQTAWFTSGASWRTRSTDTPASTQMVGRLANPGTVERTLAAGGLSFGAAATSWGVVELANTDGALDEWVEYSVAGHPLELFLAEAEGDPSSAWTTGPVLRMLTCRPMLDRVLIEVRDRTAELDVPLAKNFFAGTGDLEGESWVAGQRKPWGAGDCYNVEPVLINDDSAPIYVVHDGAIDSATIGRYERAGGATQAREANYTSLASLMSTAPSAGAAKRYPAGGALRLGTSSSYPITSDISFGGTTSKLAHRVLEAMALRAGIASGDISSSDLSALDSSPTINAGYYCRDDETARSAMGKIASGGGLYFYFDFAGDLRVKKIEAASGSAVWAFREDGATAITREIAGGVTAPVWEVTMRWRRRWKTMADVGGAASLADRADLSAQWSEVIASDSAVLANNPYALRLAIDSYCLNLDSVTAPSTEASRRLDLAKVLRAVYRVTVPMSAGLLAVDLGAVVSLQMRDNRFGLGTAALFRVIGLSFDFARDRATYSLWG